MVKRIVMMLACNVAMFVYICPSDASIQQQSPEAVITSHDLSDLKKLGENINDLLINIKQVAENKADLDFSIVLRGIDAYLALPTLVGVKFDLLLPGIDTALNEVSGLVKEIVIELPKHAGKQAAQDIQKIASDFLREMLLDKKEQLEGYLKDWETNKELAFAMVKQGMLFDEAVAL